MQAGDLLLLVIVAFSQLTKSAESNEALKYHNQIIHIESIRYRAHWLAPYANLNIFGISRLIPNLCSFIEAPERDVIGLSWAKWMVRPGPDETITLESVHYPHHYLYVEGIGYVKVKYYAHPNGADEALWYMESRGGLVQIFSNKLRNKHLDVIVQSNIKTAIVTIGFDKFSLTRNYQPAIDEVKTLISVFDNSKGNTEVTHTYKKAVGISKTTSTTVSITTELGAEIKGIFTARLSATWSHTQSETWSVMVESSVSIKILPGYVKRVYQLIGHYGPFQIGSTQFYFEDSKEK